MHSPASRRPDGRFSKGVSGNPGGRPRQVVDLNEAIQAAHGAAQVLEVIEKLRKLALSGDVQAARSYLDRVVGPVRDDALIEAKAQVIVDRLLAKARAERALAQAALDAAEAEKEAQAILNPAEADKATPGPQP